MIALPKNWNFLFLIGFVLLPAFSFGQYTTTVCQNQSVALIGPDRNDFMHNNGFPISEGYLHNFEPPTLPCGITNPLLTSLVININLMTITGSPGCTSFSNFGNVLLNCPLTLTSVCPIVQDVLTPGCNTFGGGTTVPGSYSLDIIAAPCSESNNPTNTIGVDIIPAMDSNMGCPQGGTAISDGVVSLTYNICLTYVYNQAVPPNCTDTATQPCNDGNPCTTNDTQVVDDCDNSIICTPCAGTPIPSCTSTTTITCNDGNPCTTNDQQTAEACDNSIVCVPCAGTPIPSCTSTTIISCNDGNPCTTNDQQTVEACDNSIVCVPCAGTPIPSCTSTTIIACNDGNPCTTNDQQTVEACNTSIVCVPCAGTLIPSCTSTTTLACNDGNPCTTNDQRIVEACNNSIECVPCAGTPIPSCTSTTVIACNDGNPCTTNDQQTVEACDNSIVCVPCAGTPIPSCTSTTVIACNDGDPCTTNDQQTVETCNNSIVCIPCAGIPIPSCTATTNLPCNDNDPCTTNDQRVVEACDNSIECVPCAGTPIPSCTSTTVLSCNDNDPCTINDQITVESCDNTIVCIPCAGTAIASCNLTVMLPCNDGDPCTENDMETVDACDNTIVCAPCSGTAVASCNLTVVLLCDDGDPCTINDMETVDACDNSIVCIPCEGTAVASCNLTVMLPCNDGDPCTVNDMETVDACDNNIVCIPCVGIAVASCNLTVMLPCNDGDPCTVNDMETVDACNNTIVCMPCAGTPIPACTTTVIMPCDDGDPCTENDMETVDACNNAVVCIPCAGTVVVPTVCDDGICANGEEIWDVNSCVCITINVPVPCVDDGICANGQEVWDAVNCVCNQVNVPTPCTNDGDCTNGFEAWNAATCNCNITPPVLGCTNPTANNYNPLATCNDGSCVFNCPDPGNCDDGICANGEEIWDGFVCACTSINVPVPCVNDGICANGEEIWDAINCVCNQVNVPVPCVDDGICANGEEIWDAINCVCNQVNIPVPCVDDGICTNGEEVWNAINCVCNQVNVPVPCVDDGICANGEEVWDAINCVCNLVNVPVPCVDDGICANGEEVWDAINCVCNQVNVPVPCVDDGNCTNGFEVWNAVTCICNITPPVSGCTNPTANNYDPLATCDDGSCVFDCPDPGNCDDGICANGEETWDGNICDCITINVPVPCVDDGDCTNGFEVWNAATCICNITPPVSGCTNPTANNYDPLATCDDGSCEFDCPDPGNCDDGICANGEEIWDGNICDCITINVPVPCVDDGDCTNGFEVWNAVTCICNITPPISGCTNPTANNYDPLATCDDGSCVFDCPDPGNCDDGICANGEEIWDGNICDCTTINVPVPCVDDGDCTNGFEVWNAATCICNITPPVLGCTNPTANNYDPLATCDDGSCVFDCPDPGNCDDGICANGEEIWDGNICDCTTINVPVPCVDDGDCTNGFEVWNAATCICNITPPVLGCTNPTANNYDPLATCDDGSCVFDCPDPGNCDDGICANGEEIWDGNICDCTTINVPVPCVDDGDCTNGFEVWNAATCICNITPPVSGCTNPTANNYDPLATCEDGSCVFDCPDPGNCDDGICANGEEIWDGNICDCITNNVPVPCVDDGDCTNGFEVWNAATCICNITPPVSGCTNPTANNYDPLATCDDGSCVFDCPDPGNCDDGICANGEEVWDGNICDCITINVPVPCVDDGDCTNGFEVWNAATCVCNITPPVSGCTNPTANNYDPLATCDDGSCVFDCPDPGNCDDGICANGEEIWDGNICDCITINVPVPCVDDGDCTNGFEVWNAATCICNITPPVFGCTNPTANNYDPLATCDDGSCVFDCPDPGNCDDGICANGEEIWDGNICDCITINVPVPCVDDGDCTNGFEVWNAVTCICNITPPVFGCTNPIANNFDPLATCEDGSCMFDCPDPGNCDDGNCANGVEFWDDVLCECQAGTPPVDPGCDDGDCSNGAEFWDGCNCQPGISVDCNNGATNTLPCDDGDANTFDDVIVVLDCDGTICIPCLGTPCAVVANIQDPVAPLSCQSLSNGITVESTGSSTGSKFSYEWFFNNEVAGTGLTLDVFEEGVYTLVVTDNDNACTSSAQLNISLPVVDLVPVLIEAGESCAGEADGSLIVDSVVGGQEPYLFALNEGAFTPGGAFGNLAPGNYTLHIQDADGCESEVEVIIPAALPLALDLGEDQSIQLGDNITLEANHNVNLDTIIWRFDESLNCLDCLEPVASPLYTTDYLLTLVDVNGCSVSDEVTIFVDQTRRVYVPNAFSPNGDGDNEELMIYGGTDVAIVKQFKIYNRWGEQVFGLSNFEPNNRLYSWDGMYKGKMVNPGVYVYLAEVEFLDGRVEVFSGDVSVLK